MGGPRNAAAVVAVGRRGKDHILCLFAYLGRGQLSKGGVFGIEAQLTAYDLADGEYAAEALEGVEAELGKALGFILYIYAAQADLL